MITANPYNHMEEKNLREQASMEVDAAFDALPYIIHAKPPQIVRVPSFYKDEAGNRDMVGAIEADMTVLSILSMKVCLDGSQMAIALLDSFISEWVVENHGFDVGFGDDTTFVFVSRLSLIVQTARLHWNLLTEDTQTEVLHWVDRAFIPACHHLQTSLIHRWANHGTVGLAGEIEANVLIEKNHPVLTVRTKATVRLLQLSRRLDKRIRFHQLKVWGLSRRPGEFWLENLRNYKGLYYSYLNAVYIVRSLHLLSRDGILTPNSTMWNKMAQTIRTLILYMDFPDLYPFTLPCSWFPFRQIQQLFWPGGSSYVPLTADGKFGTLLEVWHAVAPSRLVYLQVRRYDASEPLNHQGPYPWSTFLRATGRLKDY